MDDSGRNTLRDTLETRHKVPFWARLLACAFLAALTVVLFWPVQHYDFVDLDDDSYVYENPDANVAAAFTTVHNGHWHPLTMLSCMLDAQVYDIRPGGSHFSNLLFHCASAVLLFLPLSRLIVVTLPCLLLLLDCWPLDRFNREEAGTERLVQQALEPEAEGSPGQTR